MFDLTNIYTVCVFSKKNSFKIHDLCTIADKTLIINAIKGFYKFDSDKNFADFLGIKPAVLGNWQARNTLNWDLIFTKCVDIDFDKLIKEGIAVEYEIQNSVNIGKGDSCNYCKEKERLIINQNERIQELKETISILKGDSKTKRHSA